MLKQAAERILARGLAPLLTRRDAGRVLVLAYHNVVPDGGNPGGDRSLHLSRRDFSDQLDAVVETHQVVPLDEALDTAASPAAEAGNEGGRPRAVVTFDDAYRGAMTCGLEELERRGLPATVFVSPGMLGADGFWWDLLSSGDRRDDLPAGAGSFGDDLAGGRGGDPADREALLRDEAGRGDAILERAREEEWPMAPQPDHARPVRRDELLEAAGRPGVTFGAHGWSHANMARLDADELEEELVRPWTWLERELGEAFLPVLAYPYGRCSDAAAGAAREAGYRAAFTVTGGSLDPADVSDSFRLPRTNIPAGVSVDGFRLRALGLLA